ncbi:hypothetical protein AB0L13_44830 [Saccharopolyspora shandongensis]|uniref:hypothetical protein n=1 Tax=Saccharopolyspora shandongensis TaxID=418495 RepID=UPI003435283B
MSFGNQYAGPAEQLSSALEVLSDLLGDTADKLAEARSGFAAADHQATEEAIGLGRRFRGRD